MKRSPHSHPFHSFFKALDDKPHACGFGAIWGASVKAVCGMALGATLGMTLGACTPSQKDAPASPPHSTQNPSTPNPHNENSTTHGENPQPPSTPESEKDTPSLIGDWRLIAQQSAQGNAPFSTADGLPEARLTLKNASNNHANDSTHQHATDIDLGAWADCNGLSGSFHAKDGQIHQQGNLISTQMGCSAEAERIDRAYFNFLGALQAYRLSQGRLILSDKAGNELHFVPMTGIFRIWVVHQMDGLDPKTNPDHAMRLYLQKDGSATLDSHCNFLDFHLNSSTPYAHSGTLSLKKNFSTPRDCEHGQAEQRLVDFLGAVTHFSLTKDAKTEILTLHSDTATAQFRLIP